MTDRTKRCAGKLIFRRFRFDKRIGKWMDAHDYGLKAWPMCVAELGAKEKAASANAA